MVIKNTNHPKQKWNAFVYLFSPIDNACSNMCHPDEDSYLSTSADDSSSSSSSLIAASNVFGDPMIASSMSSLSLSTFDKQVRESWRRARKLQKKRSSHNDMNISLLDNAITEDENEDCDKLKKEEVATTTMKATRPPLSPPKQEKRTTKKKQKIHAPKNRPLLSLSRPPLFPPRKQEKKKSRLVLAREKMKYRNKSTNTGKQQQKEILL